MTLKCTAIVFGVIVAFVAAIAGMIGFQLAQRPPQPVIVQFGQEHTP